MVNAASMDTVAGEYIPARHAGKWRMRSIFCRTNTGGKTSLKNWLPNGWRVRFCAFDRPPAVGPITVNALVAATDLIIPVQPEVASLYGLVSILDTVAVIQEEDQQGLNLLGMLVTQYDRRTTLHAEILEAMRKQYRGNGLFHGHQPFHQGGRVHEQKRRMSYLTAGTTMERRTTGPLPGRSCPDWIWLTTNKVNKEYGKIYWNWRDSAGRNTKPSHTPTRRREEKVLARTSLEYPLELHRKVKKYAVDAGMKEKQVIAQAIREFFWESGGKNKEHKIEENTKTFGYLLMAVMACMTCSCRDEGTTAGPGSSRNGAGKSRKPGRAGYGKRCTSASPYHREHAGTEGRGGELEGGALPGVTAAGDVNIPFTFDGRRWKAGKQVEVTAGAESVRLLSL